MDVGKVEKGAHYVTYRVTVYGQLVGMIYETSYTGHTMYGIFKMTEDGLFPLKYREWSMGAALQALRKAAHLDDIGI